MPGWGRRVVFHKDRLAPYHPLSPEQETGGNQSGSPPSTPSAETDNDGLRTKPGAGGRTSGRPNHSSSGVRIRHSLNKDEEAFVVKRRKTVLKSLQKLKIYSKKNAVPNIALLGSGGGQRAMVALLECLVQLDKAGLLDCILYLSGISGSTWCMSSLYQVPDWSTKLGTVKNKIVSRLNGPGVSWRDALAKLKKYYYGKDLFSLTDFWAVLIVTMYVKEIDERTLTSQRCKHRKDPFPIYTVIDKQCKQRREGDPWFEISPYEAGYSLTGAFVGTSSFGSRFYNGSKTKHQPEMDMLYLQVAPAAVCSDAHHFDAPIPQQLQQSQVMGGRVERVVIAAGMRWSELQYFPGAPP
ncbi:cytosolic phospholipase A2 gamma-like protein [Labeo rohita]|uniref:Cytosolic phospholipase A2 gamma-like protein n=1 Tax=Labeo rohita TaxID=84645 RepID=A0A498NRD3_LABRO|nr:cytosolic phospholipase A2 gamma-like protein [Labeo rohita]